MPGILGAETRDDPLSSDAPVETTQTKRKLELPTKMPDIVPLNGKIVVRRFEADSTTPGGLILPERGRKRPSEGIVIAVGEGRLLDNGSVAEPRIKFKDHVLFPQVCGTDVKIDDLEYAILDETEILAVINSRGGADLEWTERLEQLRAGNEDDDESPTTGCGYGPEDDEGEDDEGCPEPADLDVPPSEPRENLEDFTPFEKEDKIPRGGYPEPGE